MLRDLKQYLRDVQVSIRRIEAYTEGLDAAGYKASSLVRDGVERNLITIGEAISALRKISPESAIRIDGALRITNFRNVIVHDYATIDDDFVWLVTKNSLPLLKQQIDAWAAELGMPAIDESQFLAQKHLN